VVLKEFRLGLEVVTCEERDVIVCEEINVDALDAMVVGSYCDYVVEPIMTEMAL
jgi:hypothetical protein